MMWSAETSLIEAAVSGNTGTFPDFHQRCAALIAAPKPASALLQELEIKHWVPRYCGNSSAAKPARGCAKPRLSRTPDT
jgi:hypothetical protein